MKRLTNLMIVAFTCCFMAYMSSCDSSDKKADNETEETTVETEVEEEDDDDITCITDVDYDECVPNLGDTEETTVSVDSDEIDKKLDEFEEMVASFEKVVKDFAEGETDLYTLTKSTEKVQAMQNELDSSYKSEMSAEQHKRMTKISQRLTSALTNATLGTGKRTVEVLNDIL